MFLPDPAAKQLGAFYASCMDEAAIEKAGMAGVKPLYARASKVTDAKSWFTAMTELQRAGVGVVWGIGSGPDLKDSTMNITQLDSGGLGLPDRDYYLDAKFKDKLAAYTTHVGKMLALAKAPGAAADVVAIETELAKVTKTGVEKRDVPASYNPTTLDALAKQVISVNWKAYFKALGVTPSEKINVGTPRYFAAVDVLRTQFKPAQWATYFTYHLLEEAAPSLPKAFDDEAFELQKILTGVEKQRERNKRCIDATTAALGELLGKQYSDKYFPEPAKQTATKLVDAIVASMHDDLSHLDWMSEQTRPVALDKLAKIVRMVGFPTSGGPTTSWSRRTTSPATCCARACSRPIACSRRRASPTIAASGR